MRILKNFALILLTTIVLVGCSKDDSKNEDSAASLIGTWKWTAETIDGENRELDDCVLRSTATYTATTIKHLLYFGVICEQVSELTGTYTRNGNILNTSIDMGGVIIETSIEITKLTSTTLETKVVDEDNGKIIVDTFTRQ